MMLTHKGAIRSFRNHGEDDEFKYNSLHQLNNNDKRTFSRNFNMDGKSIVKNKL